MEGVLGLFLGSASGPRIHHGLDRNQGRQLSIELAPRFGDARLGCFRLPTRQLGEVTPSLDQPAPARPRIERIGARLALLVIDPHVVLPVLSIARLKATWANW